MGDDRKITITVKVDGVSYDCPLDEFFGDMKGHVAALVAKAKKKPKKKNG